MCKPLHAIELTDRPTIQAEADRRRDPLRSVRDPQPQTSNLGGEFSQFCGKVSKI